MDDKCFEKTACELILLAEEVEKQSVKIGDMLRELFPDDVLRCFAAKVLAENYPNIKII